MYGTTIVSAGVRRELHKEKGELLKTVVLVAEINARLNSKFSNRTCISEHLAPYKENCRFILLRLWALRYNA